MAEHALGLRYYYAVLAMRFAGQSCGEQATTDDLIDAAVAEYVRIDDNRSQSDALLLALGRAADAIARIKTSDKR